MVLRDWVKKKLIKNKNNFLKNYIVIIYIIINYERIFLTLFYNYNIDIFHYDECK